MRCLTIKFCLTLSRFFLTAILYLGGLLPAWGQRAYIRQFDKGAVLTTIGDTVRGRIEFHQHSDQLIVFGQNGTTRALSPAQIQLFAVQGERQYYLSRGQGFVYGSFLGKHPELKLPLPSFLLDSTTVSIFRAYSWRESGPSARVGQSTMFFEQLTNGPYMLLRRRQLFSQQMVDAFYIRDPEGRINALRSPKNDVLTLFATQARQLESFAKQHQLLFTNAHHLALIVAHANGLLP